MKKLKLFFSIFEKKPDPPASGTRLFSQERVGVSTLHVPLKPTWNYGTRLCTQERVLKL